MANVKRFYDVISDMTKWIKILLQQLIDRKHIRMFIKMHNDLTKQSWVYIHNFKFSELRFQFA